MSDDGKRYMQLLDKLEGLDAKSPGYKEAVAELDRLWQSFSEVEQEEIEGVLFEIDEVGSPPVGL